MITPKERKAINDVRFILSISIVFVHCIFSEKLEGNHETLKIVEKICWGDMFQIPALFGFFVFTSYLFFQNVSAVNDSSTFFRQKIKKRVYTILVPYLIWCGISFICNIFTQNITISKIHWHYPLTMLWSTDRSLLGHPVGLGMWYIKSVILFVILSPLYYVLMKYIKGIILFLICIATYFIPIDFPFFTVPLMIGSLLAYYNINIWQLTKYLPGVWSLLPFIIIGPLICFGYLEKIPLYEFAILIAMVGFFIKFPNIIPTKLASSSTFLYFIHFYIKGPVRQVFLFFIDQGSEWRLCIGYIICSITTITISLVIYYTLKKWANSFLNILVGGRS